MAHAAVNFDSLPDELVLLIFAFVHDVRDVLSFYLVSKRVASVISQCSHLSLTLFHPMSFPAYSYLDARFFSLEDDVLKRLTAVLRLFGGVSSLYIETPCCCREFYDMGYLPTTFKWKAKVGCRFESFAYVGIDSVGESSAVTAGHRRCVDRQGSYIHDNSGTRPYFEIAAPICFAMRLYQFMILLIGRHPMLQRVKVVDSDRHGGLTIEGEDLAEVRMALGDNSLFISPSITDVDAHLKVWYQPSMLLDLCNVEVHGVRLLIYRGDVMMEETDGESDQERDSRLVFSGEFEGDADNIFGGSMSQLFIGYSVGSIINI